MSNRPILLDYAQERNESHEIPFIYDREQDIGLTYSAIDFALDKKGEYVFLECNPNGQWAWIEKRLGYPISDSIVDALQEGD